MDEEKEKICPYLAAALLMATDKPRDLQSVNNIIDCNDNCALYLKEVGTPRVRNKTHCGRSNF